MSSPAPPDQPKDEIKDTWPRFFAHWLAATLGSFFRTLLPVLHAWTTQPNKPIEYDRWWVDLIFASLVCLLAGGINSNLPNKPREILKSMGLGFAFDPKALLDKVAP